LIPDLKPDNIMIKVEDPSILEESAETSTNILCRRRVAQMAAQYISLGMTSASPKRPQELSKSLTSIYLSAGISQTEGVSRRKYIEPQR
jgi:hypothetical protein